MLLLFADRNGDDIVTEEEFIEVPPGEVESDLKAADIKWQEERRKEFRDTIDVNHDGRTDQEELQVCTPSRPGDGFMARRKITLE